MQSLRAKEQETKETARQVSTASAPHTRPWVSVLTTDGYTVGMPRAVLEVLLADTFIGFALTAAGWQTELTAKTLVQLSEAFIVRAIARAEDAGRN